MNQETTKQINQLTKVFIVASEPNYPISNEQYNNTFSVFSTLKGAVDFTEKFRPVSRFKIYEETLDPTYISNPELAPFYIRFYKDDFNPINASIVSEHEKIKLSSEFKCEVGVHSSDMILVYEFEQFLFATNLEEAIDLARKKRDELVDAGEIKINARYEDYEEEYFRIIERKKPIGMDGAILSIAKEEFENNEIRNALITASGIYAKGYSAEYVSKWTGLPAKLIEKTIKGKRNLSYSLARTMKEIGLSPEEISDTSSLSIEEIEKL